MVISRRRFLQQTALASFVFPALVHGQNLNSKLQLVQVGCAGKGGDDMLTTKIATQVFGDAQL